MRQDIHHPLSRWLLFHYRAVRAALLDIARSPVANFITIFVIGIAVALPLGLFVLIENLQYVDGLWDTSTPTISLYLKTEASQTQINEMISELQKNAMIKKVNYVSPEAGLKSFEKNTPLSDVSRFFEKNPIPATLVISPARKYQSPETMTSLYDTLKQMPLVDVAQLDQEWMTRLFEVITIGKSVMNALSLLFGIAIVLIIGHTLHATLEHHVKEILILRLVGASERFIRRPLIYTGIFYGLLGGTIAWVAINLFVSHVQVPISRLAETYQSAFLIKAVSLEQGVILLGICAMLGFIGARLITAQFMHQPESAQVV